MPEYLAPGVYVEETSFRSKSIEGVSTSTTAFVGPTRKGPLSKDPEADEKQEILTPEVITSYGEFERVYGGLGDLSFTDQSEASINYMAHAVKAFFDNGGARLYVARVFQASAGSAGVGRCVLAGKQADPEDNRVDLIARFPGSGLNCKVDAFLKATKSAPETLEKAPAGSLLRTGGDKPAASAELKGGGPTFALKHDDTLTLSVKGTKVSIKFEGTKAELVGDSIPDPAKIQIGAGDTLTVRIAGQPDRTIPLTEGEKTLADIRDYLNPLITGGFVRLDGVNKLSFGSDREGTDASVATEAYAPLGLKAESKAGGGNVGNLSAVTIVEITALLEAETEEVRATAVSQTGKLLLSTKDTGEAVTLKVHGDTTAEVKAALGLDDQEAKGVDGSSTVYYHREGDAWTSNDAGIPNLDVSAVGDGGMDIITLTLVVEDSDKNVTYYEDMGFSPSHPLYIGNVLKETPDRKAEQMLNPVYVKVGSTLNDSDVPFLLVDSMFGAKDTAVFNLTGGDAGIMPTKSGYETGLKLLETIEDISIIASPGHSAFGEFQAIQGALISHAERMKYRIAVLDTPAGNTLGDAMKVRSKIDSKYAALYFPWVVVSNPLARPSDGSIPKEIALPPSGFVCGVYARTDINRGVFKAPANEIVRGALRFEREINKAQQDTLNPMGVNCLRFFYGRGYRIWGARTSSSDPEWKYVNVRRYFIYLERSIDRSTQWVVFEPNGERLWANIRETVSNFLFTEWKNGALLGAKPEEAFFVRCDRSTMTQNDLDNGRLICEIGVAVLYPAEFVIFRIGQKTADARA